MDNLFKNMTISKIFYLVSTWIFCFTLIYVTENVPVSIKFVFGTTVMFFMLVAEYGRRERKFKLDFSNGLFILYNIGIFLSMIFFSFTFNHLTVIKSFILFPVVVVLHFLISKYILNTKEE